MSSVNLGSRAVRALLLAALLGFLAAGAVVGVTMLDDDSRDDAPGTTATTSATSGERSDPTGTPSTDTDPSMTGPTTAPPSEDGGRFDADPLDPADPLGPGKTPPTIEPPTCIPEPGKACPHDGAGPADQ